MTVDETIHPRKSRKRSSKNDRHHSGRQRNESRHRHRHSKSRQHRHSKSGAPDYSSTIEQFCEQHGIGRSTYYDLRKKGLGPVEMRIGSTIRISAQANRDWIKKMEAGVAQAVPLLADVKLEHSDKNETSDETDTVVRGKSHEKRKSRRSRRRRRGRKERGDRNRRHAAHRRDFDEKRDLDLD